ncbi:ABC transporter permease [Microvirga massiliensis]|uniref:ABC transporter permease n=1 Tax=Microvirga massiliensis TaxID=1033741 RepID=UPI00062B9232|nr:ABC transporter permease [Microvirga massiliensis]
MSGAGLSFVLGRVIRGVVTVWIAVSAVFFALRTIPGDAADAMMGQQMSAEGVALIRRQMGLDQPLVTQYLTFIGDLLRGDLGLSLAIGKPVSELLWQVAPFTAVVVLGALLIGAGIGIPLGLAAAKRRNSVIDAMARTLSLTGLVIPGFIIGILLMIPFSVWLGWFPVVGGGEAGDIWSLVYFGTLPALAGGLGMAAYLTRLTRATALDLMREDFVRTARAKGLSETTVFYRHVLRNALVPIVTFVGLYAVIMIGDSIAIEIVFSRPGFGRLIMGGISQRDYTLLQSVLLVYVLIALLVNFVVDLLYTWIDPRTKLSV